MSNAKVKCSNCGAELTNLTFSWGKKQWLWGLLSIIPFIGFIVWLQFWGFRPSHDFVSEIKVSLIETRVDEGRFDVIGRLKNTGTHTWNRITVEAEVYDKDGKFVDETSDYISLFLSPGTEENFRLTFLHPDERILDKSSKVVLKVTDADEDRY